MYHDEDTMSKIGLVRIIVLRHTGEEKWSGLQLTQIIGMNVFQFGHICNEKTDNYPGHDWISEEVDTHCRDDIDALFKDKPIGFYELMAEFYFEGHTDYWGEYDSHAELRNVSIKPTIYRQAISFDDRDFLREAELPLVGDKSDTGYYPNSDVLVSPYMPKITILKRQAVALDNIVQYHNHLVKRTDLSGMNEDQLAAFSFMMSLEIQTLAAKDGVYGVIMLNKMEQINKVADEVLKEHKLWMEHD